jgi:hypothetical protein
MYERERRTDKFRIVIKAYRKGRGGKGKQRSGKTGKRGYLYRVHADGTETLEFETRRCATFDEAQGLLRSTNLIPTSITIKHPGETVF